MDGKLQDGAHRISAVYLLMKRMDITNPLWKNVKLKVEFGKSEDVLKKNLTGASAQGVVKEQ